MHPGRSVLNWHRKTGKPYIVSPHGMLSKVALSYGTLKKIAVSFWFQNAVFQKAAIIHATSSNERDEIRQYGLKGQICIIPNGVDNLNTLEIKDKPAPSKNRIVLSLGRIHKKKALDQLVLAWKSLEPDFPEWSLMIVGPDEQGEAQVLLDMIKEAKLKRVKIQGPVFGDKKIELMGLLVFLLCLRGVRTSL